MDVLRLFAIGCVLGSLAACGGGGGGSSGGGGGGGPDPDPADTTLRITSANAADVAGLGIGFVEPVLQLAAFAAERVAHFKRLPAPATATENCPEVILDVPGSVIYDFSDNDASGGLSSGDVLVLTVVNCYSDTLTDLTSGTMTLTMSAAPAPQDYRSGFSGNLRLQSYSQAGAVLDGSIAVTYIERDAERILEARLDATGFSFSATGSTGSVTERLKNAILRKTMDYVAAEYRIDATATLRSEVLGGTFAIATPSPLSGGPSRYPTSGAIEFRGGTGNVLRHAARDADDSNLVAISLDGGAVSTAPWIETVAGFLFWEPVAGVVTGASEYQILPRSQDSFRLLFIEPEADPVNRVIGTSLSVNLAPRLYFSAPVDGSTSLVYAVRNCPDCAVQSVPASIASNGAIATVVLQSQLDHGQEYELLAPAGIIPQSGGPAIDFGVRRLSTANSLQAEATPVPAVSRPGDTVTLRATRSFSTGSPIVSYTWVQISGTPVSLTGADAATASFVMPAGAQDGEQLRFALSITDAAGESDTTRVGVFAFADLTRPYYYYRSTQSATIGTTRDESTLRSGLTGTIATEFTGDSRFGLLFTGPGGLVDRVDISATNGGTLDQGDYFMPFDPSVMQNWGAVQMLLSGPACNEPVGQFRVREIERGPSLEVVKFAADFELGCPSPVGGASMVGSVRVGSSVPLP